ncbi:hypothetical protein HMPREF0971_00518 [Segatella oris F0302]|uniref:Uncharacterized protein n=1 Tax=Segatella oris F0302 TaxID=649760 RepID=D1QNI2_9BACT|nr:hypothetical protein HMPREF0971_00518 [Segatella oris F0302]
MESAVFLLYHVLTEFEEHNTHNRKVELSRLYLLQENKSETTLCFT